MTAVWMAPPGGAGTTVRAATHTPGDGLGAPRATVVVARQRLGAVVRRKALRTTCRLSAAGRCAVTATIPARAARALGLKVERTARVRTLGNATLRIAAPGARATAAIALDRGERVAGARVRTLKVTATATLHR